MDNKTFPMAEVRKVIAEETEKQFAMMRGVEAEFRSETLYVRTMEESRWDRSEVSLNLRTDLYGEQVEGYYINYPSRWSTAAQADAMSVLMGGVAQVAKAVEALGVPYK